MKTSIKKILIAALIAILAGGLIFLLGFSISGFSFKNLAGVNVSYESYTESNEVDKLILNFESMDIEVKFDETAEKVSLSYGLKTSKNGKKINEVRINEKDGVLSVFERDLKEWMFFWDYTDPYATVTVPKNRTIELALETDSGDVRLIGDGHFSKLSVSTDTGDIEATRATLICDTNANFETDTGDIDIRKFDTVSMFIETDTGDVELGDITASEKIKLSTDSGEVDIAGTVTTDRMEIETDTGDIDAEDSILNVKNTITIETDTGDVSARLSGNRADYEIIVRTSTGNSNIENQTGDSKKLSVITSTGDIRILFEN